MKRIDKDFSSTPDESMRVFRKNNDIALHKARRGARGITGMLPGTYLVAQFARGECAAHGRSQSSGGCT